MNSIPPSIINILNSKVEQYNHIDFIENDPISIPHKFSKKQDIEIAAFFAATLAWGNRKSIITSCKKLMQIMDNSPYEFVMNIHSNPNWQKQIQSFVHRTFNDIDLEHFINFLHYHYIIKQEQSLETAFSKWLQPNDIDTENALNGFYDYFFSENIFDNFQERTKKHIAAPSKKSACKRLNMFLRWMVRKDKRGVDFGFWKQIKPSQLIMPLDVHVINVANHLGLMNNSKANWQTAVELTNSLKQLDADDPVKYDYALFSLGVVEGLK
jgi:uncharacterized protein (TIGR02757 family)